MSGTEPISTISEPAGSTRVPPAVWLGFAVSAVFLAYFFKDVEWSELGRALASAHYAWLVPTILLLVATYPVRAYRWWYLLPREPGSTFRNRFSSTVIGFMATSIFPLRAGEVVRAVLFSLKSGIPIGTSFASILLERVLDLICVLLGLGVCLAAFPGAADSGSLGMARKVGLALSGVVVLIVLVLLALKFSPKVVQMPLSRILSLLPVEGGRKIQEIVNSVIEGLTIVSGPAHLAWLLILSMAHWAMVVIACWLGARTFDIPLTFVGAMLVWVFTSLAVVLPQAPGFLGVYQVAVEESLKLLGVTAVGQSKAFAMAWWGLGIIPVTLIGFAAAWAEGLSIAQIKASRQRPPGQPPSS